MMKSITVIQVLLLCLHSCQSQLLAAPNYLWSFNLDGQVKPRSLQKGNAVVASQDGVHIFATTSDGSLHIINRNNVSPPITTLFEPSTVGNGSNSCHSGISVVNDGTENTYLVYAVVGASESRVFAVDMIGILKWEVSVEGKIIGTPLVSDKAIYISRNTEDSGFISILLLTDGAPELTASLEPTKGKAPLGPLTLSSTDGMDMVAVAESWEDGYGTTGNIYTIIESDNYETLGGKGEDSYNILHVSSWPYSAVTRPVVMNSALWLAGAASNIAGWREKDISKVLAGKKEDVWPKWEAQLSVSQVDEDQPFLTTPAVSSDSSLLFVPGTNGELYCLLAAKGNLQWTDAQEGSSPILSEPVVAGDVIYVIESENGIMRQHSVANGDRLWQLECAANDAFCKTSVMADFTISPGGDMIYYGDVSGNIVALQIAPFVTQAPTSSPTIATASPTITSQPTVTGYVPPSAAPITDGEQSDFQNLDELNQGGEEDSGNLGVTIAIIGVIAGVCLILAAISAIFRRRRNSKMPLSGHSLVDDHDDHGFDVETPKRKKTISEQLVKTPETMGIDSEDNSHGMRDADMSMSSQSLNNDVFSLVAEGDGNESILLQKSNHDGFSDDDSEMPIPPPPSIPLGGRTRNDIFKESEGPPSPSGSYSKMFTGDDNTIRTLENGNPAISSQLTVSPTSTVSESSVYTGSGHVSPTSEGGKTLKINNLVPMLPTNEVKKPRSFRSLGLEDEANDGPDDELMLASPPGAHYMTSKSPSNELSTQQQHLKASPFERESSIDKIDDKFGITSNSAFEQPKYQSDNLLADDKSVGADSSSLVFH